MRILLAIPLILLLIITQCSAQSIQKDRLDSLVQSLSTEHQAMLSIAISRQGISVYQQATGISHNAVPSNVNTSYRMGSITKIFTSTLIFQLIDQKRLTLDTRLSAYFPQIPHADSITIGQLLNHHSGVYNFVKSPTYKQWFQQPMSRKAMIDIILSGTPEFLPGTKGRYSNSNYVLLGYILEDIYKDNYANILKKKIVTPLQLKNIRFGGHTTPTNQDAYSYKWLNDAWTQQPETDLSIPFAAGGIVTTPATINTFVHGLFHGRLLSSQSLEQMKTITDNYGYGIYGGTIAGRKSWGHDGNIDSFSSITSYFPDEELGITIVSNGYTVSVMRDILPKVVSLVFE